MAKVTIKEAQTIGYATVAYRNPDDESSGYVVFRRRVVAFTNEGFFIHYHKFEAGDEVGPKRLLEHVREAGVIDTDRWFEDDFGNTMEEVQAAYEIAQITIET